MLVCKALHLKKGRSANNMNKYVFLLLFVISSVSKATSLADFHYSLPILICYDESYRNCSGDLSIETCTVKLKQHRNECDKGSNAITDESISKTMVCMLEKHLDVSSLNEIDAKCNGGMNINFTKAKEEVLKADPKWVRELLK